MQSSNLSDANPYGFSGSLCSENNPSVKSLLRWYSPTQIWIANLIGGPIAGGILAHINFAKSGQSENPPCLIAGITYAAFIFFWPWPASWICSSTGLSFSFLMILAWTGLGRQEFINFYLGGGGYKEHLDRGGKQASWLGMIGITLGVFSSVHFLAVAFNSLAVAAISPLAYTLLMIGMELR